MDCSEIDAGCCGSYFPQLSKTDMNVKVIAGSAEGVTGPVQTTWPILYLHYSLGSGATVSLDVSEGDNAMLYNAGRP